MERHSNKRILTLEQNVLSWNKCVTLEQMCYLGTNVSIHNYDWQIKKSLEVIYPNQET